MQNVVDFCVCFWFFFNSFSATSRANKNVKKLVNSFAIKLNVISNGSFMCFCCCRCTVD